MSTTPTHDSRLGRLGRTRAVGSIRVVVTSSPPPIAVAVPRRSRLAVAAGRLVAGASRRVRLGTGSVIGGRVALRIDPHLLEHLTADRDVVLVSATNGKTTTTRLLTAALSTDRGVVSNWLGANMTPGIVAALGEATSEQRTAALEVDERWLGRVLAASGARTVVLSNLSRDQLDRTQEVRDLAAQWRTTLDAHRSTTVVANADDPLVAWAAMVADEVVWVAAGPGWTGDATGCPACGGRIDIDIDEGDWHCTACALRRPTPAVTVDDDTISFDGARVAVDLELPGRINRVNAAFALAAARTLGVDPATAAPALGAVREVAGRYRVTDLDGCRIRLLLAKNPAGWDEALELLADATAPLVVSINARIADGHDPSWLWDVEFERLAGRFVVATGERRFDLAVRLRYAGVDHVVGDGLDDALAIVRDRPDHIGTRPVDIASNYTAFQDHLERVGGVR